MRTLSLGLSPGLKRPSLHTPFWACGGGGARCSTHATKLWLLCCMRRATLYQGSPPHTRTSEHVLRHTGLVDLTRMLKRVVPLA